MQALAREVVEQAKRAYERDGGKITRFHSTRYQAGTWSRSRRVVIKVEVSDQGVNTRFVVTDMEQARTKVLYQQIYCARGQAENEIKDHKLLPEIGSHILSSLRGQSVPVVFAFGGLCVT